MAGGSEGEPRRQTRLSTAWDCREKCRLRVEPIQGEGGIHVPPDGYLRAIREAGELLATLAEGEGRRCAATCRQSDAAALRTLP